MIDPNQHTVVKIEGSDRDSLKKQLTKIYDSVTSSKPKNLSQVGPTETLESDNGSDFALVLDGTSLAVIFKDQ